MGLSRCFFTASPSGSNAAISCPPIADHEAIAVLRTCAAIAASFVARPVHHPGTMWSWRSDAVVPRLRLAGGRLRSVYTHLEPLHDRLQDRDRGLGLLFLVDLTLEPRQPDLGRCAGLRRFLDVTLAGRHD